MAKNRLIYGVVLLAMLVLLFIQEEPMTYFALYAVLILPPLSLLLTLVSRLHVEKRGAQRFLHLKDYFTVSDSLHPNNVTKGEAVQYKLYVKNNSFLPCIFAKARFRADSTALDVNDTEQYFSANPRGRRDVMFQIRAKYRGNYEVGVNTIVYYDFLGLFRFKQKLDKKLIFTVVPRIRPISFLPLDTTAHDLSIARNYIQDEDYSVISDLRQYQPTDSHRRIHWKASAKKSELISKNFGEMEQKSAVLYIDNTETTLPREDTMMEALVSALAYCHQNGYSIFLRYSGDEDSSFSTNFSSLYSEAANINFQECDPFDNRFNRFISLHMESLNLLLFVQNVTEDVISLVHTFQQYGNNAILFYFHDQTGADTLKKLRELNLICVDFYTLSC
ncbi:MAG: DUF58 domain-containing protein [Oscillospiraceae bacterium]|nr:DUF58 domain-containing protein [Oscillospiraceae bacterium]